MARYENPMKAVVQRMREVVLAADQRVGECIKWQAPTFTFEGNIASFFPKSKQHASLMFHQGAKIPGRHPLLQGTGGTSRVVKLASAAEVNAKQKQLAGIIQAWCDWKSGNTQPKRPAAAKPKTSAAKPKAAPVRSKARPTKAGPRSRAR